MAILILNHLIKLIAKDDGEQNKTIDFEELFFKKSVI